MEFDKEKFSKYVFDRPHMGEIKEANVGEQLYKYALDKAGCGDSYEMTLLTDSEGKIKDAKYLTLGCGYAQATCGVLIDSIIGENITDVADWSEAKVGEKIEGIIGEYPIHKKAYLYFAKQLLDGICEQVQPSNAAV